MNTYNFSIRTTKSLTILQLIRSLSMTPFHLLWNALHALHASTILSVRPSVCLSFTLVFYVKTAERVELICGREITLAYRTLSGFRFIVLTPPPPQLLTLPFFSLFATRQSRIVNESTTMSLKGRQTDRRTNRMVHAMRTSERSPRRLKQYAMPC